MVTAFLVTVIVLAVLGLIGGVSSGVKPRNARYQYRTYRHQR